MKKTYLRLIKRKRYYELQTAQVQEISTHPNKKAKKSHSSTIEVNIILKNGGENNTL